MDTLWARSREDEDFILPTIAERLEMDTLLFKAKTTDWRAMVDKVR
jgi:hypothetical protein